MKLILVLFLFMSCHVHAGTVFDAALGLGQARVTNSDGTEANYKTIAVEGRILYTLLETQSLDMGLSANFRYDDLTNASNSHAQREAGNHLGPGLGIHLRFSKLILGYDYYYMKARHYWVGEQSDFSEFDYQRTNWYAGLKWRFSKVLGVSFKYSQSTGKFTANETGLSGDVPFEDKIYWLTLSLNTDNSPWALLGQLFGK